MKTLVSKLEAGIKSVEEGVLDVQADIREMRVELREFGSKIDRHFLTLVCLMIGAGLGLAILLAKGFHWIG